MSVFFFLNTIVGWWRYQSVYKDELSALRHHILLVDFILGDTIYQ